MTNLEAASEFIAQHFPHCALALLAGSTVRNEQTATSDLDMVVVLDGLSSCYRESFLEFGWPIEAFVHTQQTCLSWMEKDLERRRPSLPQMVSEGILVAGSETLHRELQEFAQTRLRQGPADYGDAEDRELRYRITDLLDDLIGALPYPQQRFIVNELLDLVLNYELTKTGKWMVHGKRIPQGIALLGKELQRQFTDAVAGFYEDQQKDPVVRLVTTILDSHGGRVFHGYSQGKQG